MAYTIRQLEQVLVRRAGAIMTEVGMDITATGDNDDLSDPISFALRQVNIQPADLTTPADSDLSALTADDIEEVLDLSEYRLLLNIIQNFDDVDVRIGHRQEEFSQLANRIIQRADRMRTHVRDVYGYGDIPFEAGVIDLDFDSSEDDIIAENR